MTHIIESIKKNLEELNQIESKFQNHKNSIQSSADFLMNVSLIFSFIPFIIALFSNSYLKQNYSESACILIGWTFFFSQAAFIVYQIFCDYKLFKYIPFLAKKRQLYLKKRENFLTVIDQENEFLLTFFNQVKLYNRSDKKNVVEPNYLTGINRMNELSASNDTNKFNYSILNFFYLIKVDNIKKHLADQLFQNFINDKTDMDTEENNEQEMNGSLIKKYL